MALRVVLLSFLAGTPRGRRCLHGRPGVGRLAIPYPWQDFTGKDGEKVFKGSKGWAGAPGNMSDRCPEELKWTQTLGRITM